MLNGYIFKNAPSEGFHTDVLYAFRKDYFTKKCIIPKSPPGDCLYGISITNVCRGTFCVIPWNSRWNFKGIA
ncbi:hypothetical protein Barb6_03012 [Bacteroidales bacterium Barb6]|nr:hypothetical protein Barb6_03012 [Bacteroidales bacterium Barb6]